MNIYVFNNSYFKQEIVFQSLRKKIIIAASGILHMGGHVGQEAKEYADFNKSVVWIEAIPEVHKILSENIREFPNQKAICALLGETTKSSVNFNIASNNLLSSSIYEFGSELGFSNIEMVSQIQLQMVKLSDLFDESSICELNHWVIDVQGSELEVLKGAESLINFCNSIQIESSDRDIYIGGAKFYQIIEFLNGKGFINLIDYESQSHGDLLFIRNLAHKHN
jgi:FkbM family methyltransferase